ncbi:hypothetical protein [Cypionkella psychrotolerans]|uniref:hypothetical protein n=1 Tax=Cypionkella psychrotolerans TaxID=1678131 RepID=UPI0006B4EDDB|nr:hypothetical protein [Cypionkella psychrotolerans]
MARPRKADSEKAKGREIYVDDRTWAAIKVKAEQAYLSVSRYLTRHRMAGNPPIQPDLIVRLIEKLQTIHLALDRIARGFACANDIRMIGAHLRLIVIERQITRLLDQVHPQ